MMKKLAAIITGGMMLLGLAGGVAAKEVPDASGDYPDPDDVRVRVRVFAHEPKPGRPEVATAAACTDPHVNDVVGVTGWKLLNNVTYLLNVASAPVPLGSVAVNSFETWATPSGVTFNRGADTRKTRNSLDYQNIVAWGKTPGNALGVTYVRYYTATRVVADVDTIMNSRVKWSWNQCTIDSYDAQGILTHELGHWVGLDDEYTANFVDNTMFGFGDRAEIKKSTLEAGDVAGVEVIY